MKVDEYIYDSLKRYPTLHKKSTYEESKRDILHHAFIVLGNGIEWAVTKKPEDGGYLTSPQWYKSKTDEDGYGLRKPDKPYHKSGIVIDQAYLDKVFNEKLYYVWPKDFSFKAKHPCVWESEKDTVDLNIWTLNDCNERYGWEDYTWQPYPNFSKSYSCFWPNQFDGKNDLTHLKDDWRAAAIEHLLMCKQWHEDYGNLEKAGNRRVSHYYTAEKIERSMRENKGKKGFLQKKDYNKNYDWGGDYEVLAKLINLKTSGKAITFCAQTLERLGWIAPEPPKEHTGLYYIYDKSLKMYKCLWGWDKKKEAAYAWDSYHANDFRNYHAEKEDDQKRFVLVEQTT